MCIIPLLSAFYISVKGQSMRNENVNDIPQGSLFLYEIDVVGLLLKCQYFRFLLLCLSNHNTIYKNQVT